MVSKFIPLEATVWLRRFLSLGSASSSNMPSRPTAPVSSNSSLLEIVMILLNSILRFSHNPWFHFLGRVLHTHYVHTHSPRQLPLPYACIPSNHNIRNPAREQFRLVRYGGHNWHAPFRHHLRLDFLSVLKVPVAVLTFATPKLVPPTPLLCIVLQGLTASVQTHTFALVTLINYTEPSLLRTNTRSCHKSLDLRCLVSAHSAVIHILQ